VHAFFVADDEIVAIGVQWENLDFSAIYTQTGKNKKKII